MTRWTIKWVLLAVVLVLGFWTTWPPYREHRRREACATQLERIVAAVQLYRVHTGELPSDLRALVRDPGAPGWQGPYLQPEDLQTPWGGEFVLDLRRGMVGVPSENVHAPEAVRLGGEAELALPVRDDPIWW